MFKYTCALIERARAELARVKDDHKGVTALEYGLLAGLIAVVIIVGATSLGNAVNALFGNIASQIGTS